jgi:hypothetical protein
MLELGTRKREIGEEDEDDVICVTLAQVIYKV